MPSIEKIYTCEVKKLFMRNGEKRREWVTSTVSNAIRDEVTEFRCEQCHGAVKKPTKRTANGPEPHVEHKLREDSEYCPAGYYFQQNPGRIPRVSNSPVD
jgi:hypothetical protein